MQRPPVRGRVWPLLGLAAMAFCTPIRAPRALAGVVVHGTRVIYPADRKEVTVELRNEGDAPSLVQAWIDDGEGKGRDPKAGDQNAGATSGGVPFSLTPAIFRLDPKNGQSLRIIYTGRPLASDRETVFWLNVLDIPPKAAPNPNAPNHLDFAFRHRLKLFFRPARLAGNAGEAASRVVWAIQRDRAGTRLVATNPTPYHVSLTRLELTGDGGTVAAAPAMLAPLAMTPFALASAVGSRGARVRFDYIDDYGAARAGEAPVGAGEVLVGAELAGN